MNTSGLLIAAVFWACAGLVAVRLNRDPRCPASWSLFATVVLLGVAQIDLRLPAGALAATAAVVLLRVLGPGSPAPAVARQEAVVLLLPVVAAGVVVWWVPSNLDLVTCGYAVVTWLRVGVLAAGLSRRTHRLPIRVAPASAVTGATAQVVGNIATVAAPDTKLPMVAGLVGAVALVVAVVVPVVERAAADLGVAADRRRVGQALRPLRTLLCDELPEVALVAGRTRHRWHRQAAEIRDGLVLLGPYYDATIARGAAAGRADDDATHAGAAVHAALIQAAVRAHRCGREPDEPLPEAATRGGRDWTDELAWLVLVSERLAIH